MKTKYPISVSYTHLDVYKRQAQNATYWLYVVEYANLNCQLDFNAQPTSEGYKQGGLSAGVTTLNLSLIHIFV